MGGDYRGLFPRAITPYDDNLEVAERDFIVHLQHLVRAGTGVGGVVVNDPMADGAGLSRDGRAAVLRIAQRALPDDFPLVAAVAAESPGEALDLLADAESAGADAALIYRPGGEGSESDVSFLDRLGGGLPLFVHVADGEDVATGQLAEIAARPEVAVIVSGTTDPARQSEWYRAVDGKVPVLIGSDTATLLDLLDAGADGAMLTAANVHPHEWADFVHNAVAGEDGAQEWFASVGGPLLEAMTDGGPARVAWVKQALVLLGQHANAMVRPPLPSIDDSEANFVKQRLEEISFLPAQ